MTEKCVSFLKCDLASISCGNHDTAESE